MAIYATIAEARDRGINTTTVPLDEKLGVWLEEASRVVDGYTGTAFGVTESTTRTFYGVAERLLNIVGPLSGVTSLTADGVALAADGYRVESHRIDLGSYGTTARIVAITGIWGYTDIPSPVRLATIYVADSLISQSQYRPALGTDTEGNVRGLPVAAVVPRFASNGKDSTGTVRADRLLEPYRMHGNIASVVAS